MFEWFWELLFKLTRTIFRLIDGIMSCCNMLCGLEPITVGDVETDFLTYILFSDKVMYGFKIAAVLGIIVVVAFALVAMVRTWLDQKNEGTPAQIAIKAVKSVLMFCFVPFVMLVVMTITNTFMTAVYQATLGGSDASLGNFLCGAFSQDACIGSKEYYLSSSWLDNGGYMMDIDNIQATYIDIENFDYLFSWFAGIYILINLTKSILMFVDRALSIAVLFIISPFSIGCTVIDDGAHFKLWRDQILVKFLTGYGTIIGINVYAVMCLLISSSKVVFFDGSFLNNLFKISIILGGAVSLQRLMALIGNIISAGAGSNEMRESAMAQQSFKNAAGKALSAAKGAALLPLTAARAGYNFKQLMNKKGGFLGAVGSKLGFDVQDVKNGAGGNGGTSNTNATNNNTGSAADKTKDFEDILRDEKQDFKNDVKQILNDTASTKKEENNSSKFTEKLKVNSAYSSNDDKGNDGGKK